MSASPSTALADLQIREALPEELDLVAAVTVAGFDRHRAPSPERLALLRDAAGRARDGLLLVAADDTTGELVGTASLLRAGTRYARQAYPGEAELRLLAVLPHHRGRGAGYALLAEAIEQARGWGAEAVVLDTGAGNHTAQRLYYRLGFHRAPEREGRVVGGAGPLAVFRYDLRRQPGGSSGVQVRLAAPAEYDRVGALSDAAYSHDYQISERYRASLRDVATRAHEHEVWVAVDSRSGEVLGTVATPRPGGHISELGGEGELDFRLLAVAPSARRRGIGRLLVEHVIALARQRGATRVVMNSGPEMLGAHRLYLEMGFTRRPERETREIDGKVLLAFGLDLDSATDG